jgi:hypothetical protein
MIIRVPSGFSIRLFVMFVGCGAGDWQVEDVLAVCPQKCLALRYRVREILHRGLCWPHNFRMDYNVSLDDEIVAEFVRKDAVVRCIVLHRT